jgi:hypothetical protein
VLNNHNLSGIDLRVDGMLILDRSYTTARFDLPDTVNGRITFTDPTVLRVAQGSQMVVNGVMRLMQDSRLRVEKGGSLSLSAGSKTQLRDQSALYLESGAQVEAEGRLKIRKGSRVYAEDLETFKIIKKSTWQNKKVKLSNWEADEEGAP